MRFDRSVTSIYDGNKKITLISLIIPLLMQNIFTQLYGTANTILLSGYSETAVSASSVANQLLDISVVLMTMVAVGTVIVSSIELGAGDKEKAGHFAGTGAFSVLALGIFLGAVNFFAAEPLLHLMNLRGETLSLACEYYRMRALFLPVTGLLGFFNQLLICNGFSKFTLVVGVSSNIINFLLSFAALYSDVSFMSPISRVGLAVGVAQLIGVAVGLAFFIKNNCPFRFIYRLKMMVKILKLGIPGAMVSLMFRVAQTVTTSFVALMGDDVINTKVYINNIVAFVPQLCYAISSANMVFIGRYRGARDFESADRCFKQNRAIGFSCNLVLSLLALIFHRPLMMLFTSNEEIIRAAGVIFFIDLFVELPRAINNVSEGSLSANGDVRITFMTSTLSCWLGSVGLSYILCVVLNMGLVGLWIAFAADESIKSIIYIFRWRSGAWRRVEV
ncbi:MAG: MATE family efflux transporter [Ruminococcaceae bacterium]|nr:MATE family efflux transporter [Oscillospiraceae bacterium]